MRCGGSARVRSIMLMMIGGMVTVAERVRRILIRCDIHSRCMLHRRARGVWAHNHSRSETHVNGQPRSKED